MLVNNYYKINTHTYINICRKKVYTFTFQYKHNIKIYLTYIILNYIFFIIQYIIIITIIIIIIPL